MQSYTHFTQEERFYLHLFLNFGSSIRSIAKFFGRSPSTISREIKRNFSKKPKESPGNKYNYHYWGAQVKTIIRRRKSSYRAIPEDSELYLYVTEKLQKLWSPEQISGKWRKDHPESSICFSTIYRYIKDRKFPDITPQKNLRRKGKNRHLVHKNSMTIKPDRIIPEWPKAIVERSRIGDWEGDTVYGGIGKGALVTLVDRKSRDLLAGKVDTRDSEEVRKCVVRLLKGKPVHSISFDNGSEFAKFHEIEKELKTVIYFAEPHKPWQRGTNENANDILRQYFPKGTDFRNISEEAVQKAVDEINNRPRKMHNWKSASEVFSVALT